MARSLSLPLFEGRNSAVALGFFDGFHRGHQAIVRATREGSYESVVFTFPNHPATVVDAKRAPLLLTTFQERVDRLLTSAATVVWTEFDRPFSLLEPEQFVTDILRGRLDARRVVVGPNYRYGHRAAGDVDTLRAAGATHGFEVIVVEPIREGGDLISSTRIRGLVQAGEMEAAHGLMGAPYTLSAIVERGAARGRELGTPTANLRPPAGKLIPPFGVYAVEVKHAGTPLRGVANLGVRPTFQGSPDPLLEVHLLDCDLDLYGEWLQVEMLEWLRPEQKFAGLAELKEQIARDVARVRSRG